MPETLRKGVAESDQLVRAVHECVQGADLKTLSVHVDKCGPPVAITHPAAFGDDDVLDAGGSQVNEAHGEQGLVAVVAGMQFNGQALDREGHRRWEVSIQASRRLCWRFQR